MFRGNHPAKVDEKGRLKLPAAFKELLDAQNVTQYYITSADGKSAEIWPLPEWKTREAALMEAGTLNPSVNRYVKQTSFHGKEAECDSQGRVLLPQLLRGKAVLDDAEVAVLGKGNYLEVVNEANLMKQLEAEEVTADDYGVLANIFKQQVKS